MKNWKQREIEKCKEVLEELILEKRSNTFSFNVMLLYYESLRNTKTIDLTKYGKR